jgi:hypothetical protein
MGDETISAGGIGVASQWVVDGAAHVRGLRVTSPGGVATTVHVSGFALTDVAVDVVSLSPPQPLAAWCDANGVREAITAGFFEKDQGVPLGELWIGGSRAEHRRFATPWNDVRACLHVDAEHLNIGPRPSFGDPPGGHLLQAGPLLVSERAAVVDEHDPEGFSSTAYEFDSDITDGRYPRAAIALTEDSILGVVVDGRSDEDTGLTLAELAELLVLLGADAALNLDGGASTALIAGGRLQNTPRTDDGEALDGARPTPTAIVFRER